MHPPARLPTAKQASSCPRANDDDDDLHPASGRTVRSRSPGVTQDHVTATAWPAAGNSGRVLCLLHPSPCRGHALSADGNPCRHHLNSAGRFGRKNAQTPPRSSTPGGCPPGLGCLPEAVAKGRTLLAIQHRPARTAPPQSLGRLKPTNRRSLRNVTPNRDGDVSYQLRRAGNACSTAAPGTVPVLPIGLHFMLKLPPLWSTHPRPPTGPALMQITQQPLAVRPREVRGGLALQMQVGQPRKPSVLPQELG